MIKLLVYMSDFYPIFSGHGTHLYYLLPEFKKYNIYPWVITKHRSGLKREEIINGILIRRPTVPTILRKWGLLHEISLCMHLLKYKNEFDIALISYGFIMGAFIKLICRKPVIRTLTLMGSDDPLTLKSNHSFRGKILYSLYKKIDAFIAISPALYNSFLMANLPLNKCHLIPVGTNTNLFKPADNEDEKKEIRKSLNLPVICGTIFLFVGFIIPRKGVHNLITVWKIVTSKHKDAHLIICGPNHHAFMDYYNTIQRSIEQLNLKNNVHLIGQSDKIPDLMRACDGFVFASNNEGLPNVILEAMASGLPVVVKEMPGITDFIFSRNNTGITVPSNDNDLFAQKVIELIENPELRKEMGRNAREEVLLNFSLEKEANENAQLIENIYNSHKSRS